MRRKKALKPMDAHPVPQNVTAFEFHLVGDMTIKQFGYLGVGVAIAYFIFIFFANSAPLVAYPLIFFFALTGISFAFIPINQRPLDQWVGAYIKAIFNPTQRSWKLNKLTSKDPIFQNRLAIYMSQIQGKTYMDQNKAALLPHPKLGIVSQRAPITQNMVQAPPSQPLKPFTEIAPSPKLTEQPKAMPTAKQLEDTVNLAKEAQDTQGKIVETEHLLDQLRARAGTSATEKGYAQELNAVVSELESLTQKASQISGELNQVTHSESFTQTGELKVVTPVKKALPAHLSLTSTPNVINGIVTDAFNNYLDGVIVVTHDKDGLPVRALKSNKLGQFVAATPLPNGTYTLTLEKENLIFDKIQVTLDGKIMQPVIVAAKRGVTT